MPGSLGSVGTATVDVKADLSALDSDLGKIPARVAQMSSQVDASMSGVKGGFRNAGQAALEFSRGIEDLQYGLNGIINNIPGLVMAMGGGAGLTAAISLSAVAVNQLVNHWEELATSFGKSATLTEAERMERLAKATEKTAAAEEKLRKYKERQATIDAQQSSKSDAQKATADAVRKAVENPNYDRIITGIIQSDRAGLISSDENARNAADAAAKRAEQLRFTQIQGGGVRERTAAEHAKALAKDPGVKALDSALNEALIQAAMNLVGAAETDPNKLKALQGIVRGNPGAFPDHLAGDLAGAKDAHLREQFAKTEEAELKALDERLKAREDAAKKVGREWIKDRVDDLRYAMKERSAAEKQEKGWSDALSGFAEGAVEGGVKAVKGRNSADMQSLDSYLNQIATAGQKADKTPDLLSTANGIAAKIAANTAALVAMGPQVPQWRKKR